MNEAAFSEMLGVVDDAIDLADSAVKSAEVAHRAVTEPVTLVKVAAVRYQATARELMKTGAFREHSRDSLAKSLEAAGPAGLLEVLEKLASRAVFPLDADFGSVERDLVDKSAATRMDDRPAENKTALWERCCHEAGLV